MNGQSPGIESIPILPRFWKQESGVLKILVGSGPDLYANQLDWVDWYESIHFTTKSVESIQFHFQGSWLVIEPIRFHKEGDKKVNEIDGFPKK